jgi:hypothetical protein
MYNMSQKNAFLFFCSLEGDARERCQSEWEEAIVASALY